MLILHHCTSLLQSPKLKLRSSNFSGEICFSASSNPLPFVNIPSSGTRWRPKTSSLVARIDRSGQNDTQKLQKANEEDEEDVDEGEGEDYEEVSSGNTYRGRKEEKDYDRDPEYAELLGGYFDNPEKAQARVEERIRKKRSKILQTKTGSPVPMKVTFKNFDFSNSYIWFELYNAPLPNDISLFCDTIRSWHIIGRLGGCNSMNMQLSQSPLNKRPSYDATQGANVTPTTFFNIGDFEVQDNLARVWVDIGTRESLVLDILINALAQISSDYVGIKQVVFGGSEFENWSENLTSEDTGCSVHKI